MGKARSTRLDLARKYSKQAPATFHKPKEQKIKTFAVFLRLLEGLTITEFKSLVRKSGFVSIASSKLLTGETSNGPEKSFISFSNQKEAEEFIKRYNGAEFRGMKVETKFKDAI